MAADLPTAAVGLSAAAVVATPFIAPAAGSRPTAVLAAALFVSSAVHIAAGFSLVRLPEMRKIVSQRRWRLIGLPLGLVPAAAIIAVAVPPHRLGLLLLAYFGWQFHHYQKQNLGIAALSAAASGVPSLRRIERTALIGTGWIGIAGLTLRPAVLQVTSLAWRPSAALRLVTIGFIVWTVLGVAVIAARASKDRTSRFCAAYLMALGFPAPIFVFGSPYAAIGGLTIAHGLQYLLLVGAVSRCPPPTPSRVNAGEVVALVLAGGLLLAFASHLHTGGDVARAGYGAYLGIVMSHFVVDASIWRLRDPDVRSFLSGRLRCLAARPAADVSASGVEFAPWRATISATSDGMPALQP